MLAAVIESLIVVKLLKIHDWPAGVVAMLNVAAETPSSVKLPLPALLNAIGSCVNAVLFGLLGFDTREFATRMFVPLSSIAGSLTNVTVPVPSGPLLSVPPLIEEFEAICKLLTKLPGFALLPLPGLKYEARATPLTVVPPP